LAAPSPLSKNALSALCPCNGFAGRSREGPPDSGRAGPAATGTGSEIHSRNNCNSLVGEPCASVNADPDDQATFLTDPKAGEICAICTRPGTAGRPLCAVFRGHDAFWAHEMCTRAWARRPRSGEVLA
jgi:hypothetical protein